MSPDAVITSSTIDVEGIFYSLYRLLLKIGSLGSTHATDVTPNIQSVGFQNFYLYTEIFFFVVGVAALIIYIYYRMARVEILKKEDALYAEKLQAKKEAPQKNPLWESIQEHLRGDSPAGWKLAVIEADKILDDITIKQGFFGQSLGERLKNSDESVFRTLQDAWEAHKIRNRIAHEAGYLLSRRDAQRAIFMYEKVFKEFKAI